MVYCVQVLGLTPAVKGYHLANNMPYDCWSLDAGEQGNTCSTDVIPCEGQLLNWVSCVPVTIKTHVQEPP